MIRFNLCKEQRLSRTSRANDKSVLCGAPDASTSFTERAARHPFCLRFSKNLAGMLIEMLGRNFGRQNHSIELPPVREIDTIGVVEGSIEREAHAPAQLRQK